MATDYYERKWGRRHPGKARYGRHRLGQPLPRVHPTGLQCGDRIKCDDGRWGRICCAVERGDRVAYVLPDDETKVQTVQILAWSDDLRV